MVTGNVANYAGRTVDLAAYHGILRTREAQLEQTLATEGTGGAIVTGIQKVAQRFLTELLKERGSMRFRPDEGTDFLTEARLGGFQTQADVLGAFYRGVVEVKRVLQLDESPDDPDDEKFRDAAVIAIEVAPGEASIRFELQTAAGNSREFIFPLPVTV